MRKARLMKVFGKIYHNKTDKGKKYEKQFEHNNSSTFDNT